MIYLCQNKLGIAAILVLCLFGLQTKAQLSIDTSYNFDKSKKSFPIVFIVDTTNLNSSDSTFKNQLVFTCINPTKKMDPLRVTYALDKKEYANNGKDKLKEYLGVDSNSIVFKDAIFIELLMRKKVLPLDLVKQDTKADLESTESTLDTVKKYAPLAIGALLALFGIYALTKKNKSTTDMKQEEFLKQAIKIQGEAKYTAKSTEKLDEVLGWLQNNRKDFLEVKESYIAANQKLEDGKKEMESVQKTIEGLKATISQLKEDAAFSTQFNEKMQEQYLNKFQKEFASGSLQYPLSNEDKQSFTETIYSMAFHYMSYIRSVQQRDDANDAANKNMLLNNTTQIDSNKVVPLLSPADIQKFNADVLFIAEELRRNGVTELKNVNYKGYYFKG
jgi:archaellum component FlaC